MNNCLTKTEFSRIIDYNQSFYYYFLASKLTSHLYLILPSNPRTWHWTTIAFSFLRIARIFAVLKNWRTKEDEGQRMKFILKIENWKLNIEN